MPTAINPKTGEVLTLGSDGQWVKPTMAANPQTGEKLYLDGGEWKPIPAMGQISQQDREIEQNRFMPRVQGALEQGVTMGFADEVGAAGSAAGAFLKNLPQGLSAASEAAGKRYDERLGAERALGKEFAKENPISNTALETVGGLALGPKQQPMGIAGAATLPPAGASPTLKDLAWQGAKTGAAYGGVTGFGNAEGGLENRALGAGIGAGVGGVIGAATPLLVKGAQEGWSATKNMFNASNPDQTAQQLILRAMERDGMSPQQAAQTFQQWQASGAKPETLIDVGGENVRGLMRGAASLPGPARQATQDFAATRQAGQGSRIADDVANSISPNTNYSQTLDDLMAQRAAKASPLYKEAFDANKSIDSPLLQRIEKTPAGQKAFAQARAMMLNDMQRLGATDKELTELAREAGLEGDKAIPKGGVASGLKLEFWDYVKRALDDQIGAAQYSGAKNETRILTGLKNSLVDELDRLDVTGIAGPNSLRPEGGAYARARASFAGPSRSAEALELGRSILKEDSDITAKAISSMPEGDREFFKAGVVRAIKDAADNAPDGADITKRFFGKPALREKLRAAFDSDAAFSKFEDAIKREAAMYTNAQMINPRAGSRTAVLEQEQGDVRHNPVVQFGMDLFNRGPFQAVGGAASTLYDRGRGINAGTSQKLAEYLLASNPNSVRNTFGTLEATKRMDIQRTQELARQLGLLAAQEGRQAGSF